MPNPNDYSTQDDFMGACVPMMMKDNANMENKQAVAACANMWKNKGKSMHLKADSLQDQIEDIYAVFNQQFPQDMNIQPLPMPMSSGYIDEIYPDFVIVKCGEDDYQVSYTTAADGTIVFAPQTEWVKVEENTTWTPTGKAIKKGARNSGSDMTRLQQIHDLTIQNGAMCSKKGISVLEVVAFGNQIKATQLDDGSVKLGGYLVTFGDEDNTDLTGDYFTKNTDFGDLKESDVYFNHRIPVSIGGNSVEYKSKLSKAKLIQDDIGIFAETILKARNAYEQAIIDAGISGKLGWSSGTASHLVEREEVGKAWEIKAWALGLDASLTPMPAEPRNLVVPIKSLITPETDMPGKDDQKAIHNQKESDMEKDELKAMFDENNKTVAELVKSEAATAAEAAVTKVLEGLPEVKAKLNSTVYVTKDEADEPFKSIGDNLIAIANLTRNGKVHPRIKGLRAMETKAALGSNEAMETKAALGSNEAIPSQGEFLLEPTITQNLIKPIHDQGVFTKDVQRLPVGPNSNSGWIPGVDETSRATGSRWGGVRGYHLAETATLTASQPKFRKINWELHKLHVLQYATDELLNDAGMLSAIINQSSAEELDFLANYDVLLGIGGDRPAGVLLSSALISFARVDASKIQHADIIAMWARMSPRSKANAKWYISSDVHPQLDALTFTSGSTGILSPYIGYGPDGVMRIYGKEVVETEFNPALGTLGDILLADMSEYLFWEKNAVEAASSIHVQFLTDQTAFRFIYRCDGQTALASAITPANGGNTQSPFVALTASS